MHLASLDISGGIGLIGTILGLIILVASSVAVARVSVLRAQIEGLREDRDDQEKRIDRLEGKVKAETARADTAEARVTVLEGVVTGRAELASISSLLQAHDRKTERMADDILKAVGGKAS